MENITSLYGADSGFEIHIPFETADILSVSLFGVQATVVIVFCRIFAMLLDRIQQPPVVGEILAGIILGPTVMGRIPGYTEGLFPASSIPMMNLVATLGLVLLLFLIGLETDPRQIMRSSTKVVVMTLTGFIFPFSFGVGVSRMYWLRLTDQSVPFTTFMVFVSTAIAVTSLSVLARVVTNLKLVGTSLGTIAVACGCLNDTIGYILMALGISLVPGAGTSSLTPIYILAIALGWVLTLTFIVRPSLMFLIRVQDDINKGPNSLTMTFVLLIALGSAFVTDMIGIHPIFGAFLGGLIIPHDGGFAIRVTEKIEELVSLLFIPLYFALSGFKTQLGLLNTGEIWGLLVLGLFAILIGKLTGTISSGLFMGMTWREAVACGALSTSKAIIELIILNVASELGVINPTLYAMFMVLFICSTLLTTPLTLYAYPPWYRKERELQQARSPLTDSKADHGASRNIMFAINNAHHLPALMTLVNLTKPSHNYVEKSKPIRLHILRYLEYTDRVSSVMHLLEDKGSVQSDPLLNTVWTFGQLNRIEINPRVVMESAANIPTSIAQHATDVGAGIVIIPWDGHRVRAHHTVGDGMDSLLDAGEDLFHSFTTAADIGQVNTRYAHFVNKLFSSVESQVGVLVDRGFGIVPPTRTSSSEDDAQVSSDDESDITTQRLREKLPRVLETTTTNNLRIFVPFFGGADDRVALEMAATLCAAHPKIRATVLRVLRSEVPSAADVTEITLIQPPPKWYSVLPSPLRSAVASPSNSPHATVQRSSQVPSRSASRYNDHQLELVKIFKSAHTDPPTPRSVPRDKSDYFSSSSTAQPTSSTNKPVSQTPTITAYGSSGHEYLQTVQPGQMEQMASSAADQALLTRLFGAAPSDTDTKAKSVVSESTANPSTSATPRRVSIVASMVAAARREPVMTNPESVGTSDTTLDKRTSASGAGLDAISEANTTNVEAPSATGTAPSNLRLVTITTSTPLSTAIAQAKERLSQGDLLILGRNKRGVTGIWNHREEIDKLVSNASEQEDKEKKTGEFERFDDFGKVLGSAAQGMFLGGVQGSLLVVQAGNTEPSTV